MTESAMKIKVISLASSTARRNSIRSQLERLDVPFEFFDAITPETAQQHVHHYDEKEFFKNCGRYATGPEIACYASHLTLWRQCANDGRPYLILEDDAKLDATFMAGLLVAASQINRLGLIRVSLPETTTALSVTHLGPFDIEYCRRVPLLALGYAISSQAATRLASAAAIVEEPVDKFMQRIWHHGQPVYAMTPPFVRLTRLAGDSDIGARTRPRHGLSIWTIRAMRKGRNSVLRTIYNLAYMHRVLRGSNYG